MSYLPGSHGQRDPYDGTPQYGSAGGSGGQPFNPLMYNFNNRGGGNTQSADKLNLRKQGNPTMLASNPQPIVVSGDYQHVNYQPGIFYQGGYDPRHPDFYDPRHARPQAQGGYQTTPPQHIQEHQELPHQVSAPPAQPTKLSQVAAAAGVAKVPVESETEYPRPHRGDSLLGIFFTDPSKFEGS